MGLLRSRWEHPDIPARENRPGRRLYELTALGEANRRTSAFTASFTLHVFAIVTISWFAARAVVSFPARKPASPLTIVVLQAQTLSPDPTPEDLGIRVDPSAATLSLPGFSFDFRKVIARAGALFPFLTGSVSLERLASVASREPATGIGNPLVRAGPSDVAKPPLVMTDAAVQSLLDASWSRRDRWQVFQPIIALAERYSARVGRLSDLLAGYVAQNGLQPYADPKIRDPRLWTELGLASDHADFIDFIARYAAQQPSTKATTELLFLLDKIAQASFDALITLLDVVPEEDLQWTRGANEHAYKAIAAIQQYYRVLLDRRNLTSRAALKQYYDEARLSILSTIVATTPDGYRVSDARFLIGSIYWNRGRPDDAAGVWRDITVSRDDAYAFAYEQILALPADTPLDARRVSEILSRVHGTWLSFSATRLRQFGYHFDTY